VTVAHHRFEGYRKMIWTDQASVQGVEVSQCSHLSICSMVVFAATSGSGEQVQLWRSGDRRDDRFDKLCFVHKIGAYAPGAAPQRSAST